MDAPPEWPAGDVLADRARATPDRTALVAADGRTWTYRELDSRVDALAGRLGGRVGAGDRVATLLGTRVAVVDHVHAAVRLGATLVPLNVRLTAEELAPQVGRATPELLVAEAGTTDVARAVADCPVVSVDGPTEGVDGLAVGRAVEGMEESSAEDTGGVDSGFGRDDDAPASDDDAPASDDDAPASDDDALARDDDAPARDDAGLARDDDALVLFTSGTTGEPKGVRLTLGNLLASATASAFRLGVEPEDRWLVCLPTYHMGGLAPVVRSALYGTAVVLQEAFDPEATARAMDDRGVTGVSLVPTMLRRLLDAGWTPGERLRFVLLGGAPAPPELIARCEAAGVPVHPTYGLTETASQVATARPAAAFEHPGTVGQPLSCTAVTVVDDDGEPVPVGESGELVVDGPTVTPGYLADARTEAAVGEHGLHTGDVGYRDADGRLWVVGRVDDRVVTGGENVHPGEVAAVLREHPAVREAAVVGLPDEEWGERVAALVVPDDVDEPDSDGANDPAPTPAALREHCEGRLAGFKHPRTVALAAELPRTASGTVDRAAVRERLRKDRDGG